MARETAIADEDVEAFCRDFRDFYTADMSFATMIPKLKKYWTGSIKLTEPVQVANMSRGLTDGRAPKWYTEWFFNVRPKVKRSRNGGIVAPVPAPKTNTNGHTNGHANGHAKVVAKPAKKVAADPAVEVFGALEVLRAHGMISPGDAWSKFAAWKAQHG